jgi:hypothetical protein
MVGRTGDVAGGRLRRGVPRAAAAARCRPAAVRLGGPATAGRVQGLRRGAREGVGLEGGDGLARNAARRPHGHGQRRRREKRAAACGATTRVRDEHEETEAFSTRGTASWPGLHARRPARGCGQRRVARPGPLPGRFGLPARGARRHRGRSPKVGSVHRGSSQASVHQSFDPWTRGRRTRNARARTRARCQRRPAQSYSIYPVSKLHNS